MIAEDHFRSLLSRYHLAAEIGEQTLSIGRMPTSGSQYLSSLLFGVILVIAAFGGWRLGSWRLGLLFFAMFLPLVFYLSRKGPGLATLAHTLTVSPCKILLEDNDNSFTIESVEEIYVALTSSRQAQLQEAVILVNTGDPAEPIELLTLDSTNRNMAEEDALKIADTIIHFYSLDTSEELLI